MCINKAEVKVKHGSTCRQAWYHSGDLFAFPPPYSLTYIQIQDCCRGVCVLYTKTHSSQPPPGALHVNNPNYTETTRDGWVFFFFFLLPFSFFITEPLLCAANKVSLLLDWTERKKLQWETGYRGREKWRSEVDEVSWLLGCRWCLYSQLPPPFSDLVELLTCRCRRSMLVGRRPQRDLDLTQGNSKSHTKTGVFQSPPVLLLFIHLLYLGNVARAVRKIVALMCCLNA